MGGLRDGFCERARTHGDAIKGTKRHSLTDTGVSECHPCVRVRASEGVQQRGSVCARA